MSRNERLIDPAAGQGEAIRNIANDFANRRT
jgi:hypothetical protein